MILGLVRYRAALTKLVNMDNQFDEIYLPTSLSSLSLSLSLISKKIFCFQLMFHVCVSLHFSLVLVFIFSILFSDRRKELVGERLLFLLLFFFFLTTSLYSKIDIYIKSQRVNAIASIDRIN